MTAPNSKLAPRPRRSQAERRQEAEKQIILSAIRLIAHKGIGGLTLAAAGEGAGYSRGIVSHYFGRKDELLVAIVRYITSSFSSYLNGRFKVAPGMALLEETVCQYFRGVQSDSLRMRALQLILTEAVSNAALKASLTEANMNSVRGLERPIRDGIARGEIRADLDPQAQAIIILAGLRGVMAQWLINTDMMDLERLREEFIASMKRSLQP